ncbi:hypothetical protein FEM54_30220, partial [Pseudomonas edaphica]
MPSLSEAPSGGAKTFWLLLGRLPKVTRCKSGTNSRRYPNNGYTPNLRLPVAAVTAAYGSALTAGHFCKDTKVTKKSSPQHSVPRLGSACPHSGLNPWAAAMGHPWPSAANPASCRVTHG